MKIAILAVAAFLASSPVMAHGSWKNADGFYTQGNSPVTASPAIPNFFRKKFNEFAGTFTGMASYYGHGEKLNRYTSDGSVFNPNGLTAAHRTLPLGTRVRVTYAGRSVIVKVNDRGPAAWTHRVIDLSYGAAKVLGITQRGTAPVQIAVLG